MLIVASLYYAIEIAFVYQAGGYSGLGFMLGNGWVGIDIDHCIDPATGQMDDNAASIVAEPAGWVLWWRSPLPALRSELARERAAE